MTEYQNTRRQPARKTEKPMTRRERRRLLRLTVSGVLLVLVVAVKLLMPDVMGQYREKILHLMGENTDFVAAFSAVGRAFSGQGGIRDTLEDAYVAVFGEKEPQEAAAPAQTAAQIFSGVYGPENLPEGVKLEHPSHFADGSVSLRGGSGCPRGLGHPRLCPGHRSCGGAEQQPGKLCDGGPSRRIQHPLCPLPQRYGFRRADGSPGRPAGGGGADRICHRAAPAL